VTILTPSSEREKGRASWLRVADVARLLGMSPNTVRRWSDAGRIPAHRSPGGHRRYLLEEILALAPELQVAPAFEAHVPAAATACILGPEVALPPPPSSYETPCTASAGPGALDAVRLAELVQIMEETPHDVPARAARMLREITDAGRCEVLVRRNGHLEVLVSVDAGGEDVSRAGRRRVLADSCDSQSYGGDQAVALRKGVASTTASTVLRQRGCHALLWVPAAIGPDGGALELIDTRDRDLSPFLPLATAVARLVAHALDFAATKAELDERQRTMRDLIALSQEVAQAKDLKTFVQTVAERLMTAVNADYVDVWRIGGEEIRSLLSMSRDGVDASAADRALDLTAYPATAAALDAREPLLLGDLHDERLTADEVRAYRSWGFNSSASLPMVAGGQVVGMIELYDDAERDWSEHVGFLTNVAQLLAGIFENTVLLDEVQRRAAYERELVELAGALSRTSDARELAVIASSTLRRVLDTADCDIWHLQEGRIRCLISIDTRGIDTSVEGKLLDLDLFPTTATALRHRELVVFADLDDPRLTPEEVEDWAEFDFRSGLTLPLVAGDEVVGLIDVFDTRERDYAEALEFVISAGRMVADGIKNAHLLKSLRQSNRGLRELVELGDVVAEADDLGQLVRRVAERLRLALRAEDCDIWRIEGDQMECLASIDSRGWDEGEIGRVADLCDYPGTVAALERDAPIVVDDLQRAPLADEERVRYGRWGYRSMVSMPLVTDGRPVGLIDIFDRRPRDWTDLLDFIRNVGALVAGAFDKAVLLGRLEKGNRELRLLVDSSLDFGATLDKDAVIRAVAHRIRNVSGADICDIYEVDGDEAEILTSVRAEGDPDVRGLRYPIADFRTFVEARATHAPAEMPDVQNDPRATPTELADAARWGYTSTADIPLMVRGDVIGFVSIYRRTAGRFADMEVIVGLAQIAAQAIANAKLYRHLDENARRLGLLTESTLELTSTLDLEDVLTRLAWRLCCSVGVPDCRIHVVEGPDLVSVMSLADGVVDRDGIGARLPLREAGVTRDVMRTKRPTVVASLDDPRLSERVRERSARYYGPSAGETCWLSLPLIAADEVIGVVELIETRGPRAFTAEERETAAAICHAAAMALTNARLFAREQAAHRETSILNEIARSTAASLDVQDIAAATARQLGKLVTFDGFGLLLFTNGKVTRIVTHEGDASPLETSDFADVDPSFVRRLLRESLLVLHLPEESPLPPGHPATSKARQMAVLALVSDDGLIGALALASSDEDAFADVNRGLLMRVATQLSLAVANACLYDEIKEMHLGNLKALSSALNAKDYYTLGHAARVAAYMVLLGRELGWQEGLLESIEEAAYLHDIGKISISDRVLLKPGRLNDREWEQMRQHPVFSADIIRPLFPDDLVLAVRHHHEKFGGGGYPDGLSGDAIPMLARAMAVVDAYDAMSCRRPYKAALSYPECLEELERCRGTQFDPAMVDAFLHVLQRVFERRSVATRIASQAAGRIRGESHATLRGLEDEGRPEYDDIAQVLREVRDANPPTRFLTTQCRVDQRYIIAVDPEENDVTRSRLGDEIFTDDELPLVLEGRIPDVNILFADEFGVWVEGLAPIRDAEGRVVAAAVADLPAIDGPAGETSGSDARRSFAALTQTAAIRFSRTEVDAITDALTGLYTHRYLHERLAEELARAREHDRPLSVLFCDLDNFRAYNRRRGHSAGDAALREVAHIIEQSVRGVDVAARYGGEEFVVALVETAGADALAIGERVRARLESKALSAGDEVLTLSVGVATFPDDAGGREELLDKADWAMCLAKRQGRNRIVRFAGEDGPGETPGRKSRPQRRLRATRTSP